MHKFSHPSQVIKKALPIVPGGPAYGAWKDLPMPIITSLYFFNVTNAEDVQLRGAVPVLEEIGPYVYQEWHNKKKIVYNTGNDTLTYQQARTYFFDAEATGKLSLEDRIVTLNAPAATINSMAKKEAAFTRGIIDIGLKAIGMSAILPRGLSCELIDILVIFQARSCSSRRQFASSSSRGTRIPS